MDEDKTRALAADIEEMRQAVELINRRRAEVRAEGGLMVQREPERVARYWQGLRLLPQQRATDSPTSTVVTPLPRLLQSMLAEVKEKRIARLAAFRESGGHCEDCFDEGRTASGYCASCPEGERVRVADEREKEAAAALVREQAWQGAGVPERWRDFRLTTSPLPRDGTVWQGVSEWLADHAAGCVITGPTGTGKTGLLVGMLRHRHDEGKCVAYAFVPELLGRLRAAYQAGRGEAGVLARLEEADLLGLDDVGMERRTDWSSDKLAELIGSRHAHSLPTIVTSNFDLGGLAARFGELGERVIYRLAEQAGRHIYDTSGLANLRDNAGTGKEQ